MRIQKNPFHLKGYHGAELFCNREKETSKLIENAKNGVNTTLFSIRRMGKTGLIHHAFNTLGKGDKGGKWKCIYVDIYATQSIAEFTNQLASAIFKSFPPDNNIGEKFLNLIKGFSPIISYDSYTSVPEISFSYKQPKQYIHSLTGLFKFLEQQKTQIIIAIDEFQQITNYPEKNTEAILRTIIQQLNKVVFIFSGSHKHLLLEMFNSAKRPFFSSTQALHLIEIDKEKYREYIRRIFLERNRKIDKESTDFILEWTKIHTYYTQALCNKIFTQNISIIKIDHVYLACDSILKEQETMFFQYRNLLTSSQWNLLKAIAKEGKVYQPTGIGFVGKYNLGNPSSVRRSLAALENKEMVFKETNKAAGYFQVYDCFLSRWLER